LKKYTYQLFCIIFIADDGGASLFYFYFTI